MTAPNRLTDSDRNAVLDLAQVMVRDLNGRILAWSTGSERLYGWTAQQATGQVSHDLLATQFPMPLETIQETLLRTGQWHGELRHRARDERSVQVASHWALQRNAEGRPELVLEVNNDITPQREAAEALFRLAAIVASSNDAIIGMTLEGIITDWNAAATAMFGYHEADVIGQPITLLYPSDRLGEETLILARLRRGELVDHFETIRRRHGGENFPVSVTISPIHGADGEIIGTSKIVRDLSEIREREQRLIEMQTELAHVARLNDLGQLVSTLVHEVNQPLTAIGNYTRATQRLIASGNIQRAPEALERIVEQTNRAHQIIQRLRDFVRKGPTQRGAERLTEIVEESIALAAIGPAARGLEIGTVFAAGDALVEIDRIQIEQVLFNLLRNALEAMQEQPDRALLVGTALAADDMVTVSVADRGPGLVDWVRQKLFEPFVTTKPNGMGVGLSVCRTIVEAHGGRLWMEDNPEGGTLFHFTLPRATDPPSQADPA